MGNNLNIILDLFHTFVLSIIASFVIYSYGLLINHKESKTFINFSETTLYGVIVISLISLILNFITPLNHYIGNILLLFSILLFFKFYNYLNLVNYLKYLGTLSFIAIILISFDTINRPDAGLYHLPYMQIIQENKIILGLTNLHFRFGHTSIMQYFSAIFNFSFLKKEIFLLPLSILFSSYFLYLISLFYEKNDHKIKFLIFLILTFSFYSYNRYSGYGNDAAAHLFVFLFLIEIIKGLEKNIDIQKIGRIILFSVFAFMNKTTMIFLIILPLYYFVFKFFKNIKFYKNNLIIVSIILIMGWTGKNIMVSGCAIYPLAITCFQNLKHTDIDNTKKVADMTEAWAKDWPNYKGDLSQKKYISNFNWLSTWLENHFKIIQNKVLIYLLILIIIYFILKFFSKSQNKPHHVNLKDHWLLIFFILILIAAFSKFPLYRFSNSFIIIPIILIFYNIISKKLNIKDCKKILSKVIIFFIIILSIKILNRFDQFYDKRNVLPNIYTLEDKQNRSAEHQLVKKISDNGEIIYYVSNQECMYSKALCTNVYNSEIVVIKNKTYKTFLKK